MVLFRPLLIAALFAGATPGNSQTTEEIVDAIFAQRATMACLGERRIELFHFELDDNAGLVRMIYPSQGGTPIESGDRLAITYNDAFHLFSDNSVVAFRDDDPPAISRCEWLSYDMDPILVDLVDLITSIQATDKAGE